jgi:small subunit ribosomal protein S17
MGNRKELSGEVVSNKMEKTVVVKVRRMVKHPLYGRYIRRSTNLKAHDEKGACQPGDSVRIRESRPISKDKHWKVIKIVKASIPAAEIIEDINNQGGINL